MQGIMNFLSRLGDKTGALGTLVSAMGCEVGQNRVEQPRATYPAAAKPNAKPGAQKPFSPAKPGQPIKN